MRLLGEGAYKTQTTGRLGVPLGVLLEGGGTWVTSEEGGDGSDVMLGGSASGAKRLDGCAGCTVL